MELRHIRYFIAVAEHGGFARAAQRMRLSQPVLSRQVRLLEQEIKATLFERSKRGVRLTYAGEVFLEGARRLLAEVGQLQTKSQEAHLGKTGALQIGLGEGFSWNELVIRSIHNFRRDNPSVALTVTIMNTPEQLTAIREGQLSAGFVVNRPRDEDVSLEGVDVLSDRMLLAVSASSRFARRPPKRLLELAEQDFFWFKRTVNPVIYDAVVDACEKSGFSPRIVYCANDLANLSLVAAGLGCSFVPQEARWRKPKNVVLIAVKDLDVKLRLEFVWNSHNQQPALTNFVRVISNVSRPGPRRHSRGTHTRADPASRKADNNSEVQAPG